MGGGVRIKEGRKAGNRAIWEGRVITERIVGCFKESLSQKKQNVYESFSCFYFYKTNLVNIRVFKVLFFFLSFEV
jgi:hypothetical protein